jgi:osmotically inducible protein OsmC
VAGRESIPNLTHRNRLVTRYAGNSDRSEMMKRKGSAEWRGDLKNGQGAVSTESGALSDKPYSFTSRFEDGQGTNPEELIGAAHAACFSMALSNELSQAGITANRIATTAEVEVRPQPGGGFHIPAVRLSVRVEAAGADRSAIETAAGAAKAGCPVSKVLNAEISMDLEVA